MIYKFNYFFNRKEQEQYVEIEAENDAEAVMKFYDKTGIAEFGCIKTNGQFFTDEKFPEEKEKIILGC